MAQKEMNLAIGLNFDLLKTNLEAMYEKNTDGSKILLLPTKVDEPATVSFNEMIADFKKVLDLGDDDTAKIENDLKEVSKDEKKFKPGNITVSLQSAYLYKTMPATGDGELDYAFALAVDMKDALPDLGFIKLNSLYMAVWNTEKKAVIKQIGGGSIDKLVSGLTG